ncbi:MAG: hypothetical protein QNJ60_13445 [Xenococcaceae cyanobacterium MO_188.B19]|nr:hypothetical protein [Xenococcaceae cyanobacterium MO_188.B19]
MHHLAVFAVFFTQSPFFQQNLINFLPEFIKKQDGKTKQDCQNAAVKRWLLKNPVGRKVKHNRASYYI